MEKQSVERIPAQIWRRAIAYFLDGIVASLCGFTVWLEAGLFQKVSGVFGYSLWAMGAMFLVYFFYHWLFLYFLAATPGKMVMGIRVIGRHRNGEGDEGLGLFQSFLRVFADQLSIFMGHGLRALALLRLDRTHVSDWVAETQVVQKAQRRAPVKRHLFWALVLCVWFSCFGFMKIYRQFQQISWMGDRIFFEISEEE